MEKEAGEGQVGIALAGAAEGGDSVETGPRQLTPLTRPLPSPASTEVEGKWQ